MQLIAVYLHVYNCLVIIIEYRSALNAMTLMGGAATSETLIGGYICTIGGAAPPKEPRKNTAVKRTWLGPFIVCSVASFFLVLFEIRILGWRK